jgi:hypothetical protein
VLLACLALTLPIVVSAQQPAPPAYTFVAEWNVPRDKWAEASAFMDKGLRPIHERLVADGTLTDYGVFETVVHDASENGYTHGVWWSATSIAAIEKARAEALKVPPAPALATAEHHDYFLRTLVSKLRPGNGSGGYLRVNSSTVQPGKGAAWRALFDKYNKPIYEELVANGTLSSYAVQAEYVVTMDPGVRMVVSVAPNADAVDKTIAAFATASAKRTQEERDAITAAFAETVVAGSNRSYMARVNSYSMK